MSRLYAHLLFAGVVVTVLLGQAQAGSITFDPSFSKAPLSGPAYTIDAANGRLNSSNLWFGFSAFGLNPGESATFTGPSSVNTIIGTVSGGLPSMISGAIKSTIPNASLFLLNPSGVVFGPGGTVSIAGGFHASTADYLKLTDGTQLRVASPGGSTLTAAPPAAFGFLASHPQAVSVSGPTLGLTGSNLSLVGGGVTVANAALRAAGGTINLVSVAGAGEVPVNPRAASSTPVTQFGPVSISGGSLVSVENSGGSPSAGSIFVRGNTITVDASAIDGNNKGTGGGGVVKLTADGPITFVSGAAIYSVSTSTGAGADIEVTSNNGHILLAGSGSASTFFSSETDGSGPGGHLDVTATDVDILGNAYLMSQTKGAGQGGAVDVTATAGGMLLDGTGGAAGDIQSITSGSGAGGLLSISAGALALAGSSFILTSTSSAHTAPDLLVSARSIALSSDLTDSAVIGSSAPSGVDGSSGAVTVTADTLTIHANGQILTATKSNGNDGAVNITVTGELEMQGSPISASTIPTGIFSSNNSLTQGNAGPITIHAGTIAMTDLADIQTTSPSGGEGGAIFIQTGDLNVNHSNIDASGGTGGTVTIVASREIVLENSTVQSVGSSGGNGTELLASLIIIDDASDVPAAALVGLQAEVTGTVAVRASDLVPQSDVRQHGCAPRQGSDRSSLLRPSPGRLRHDPGAPTPSAYLADQPPPRDGATKAAAHALPARPDIRPLAECG